MAVDYAANGWGAPSAGIYGPKTRQISNDTYTVYFTASNLPTIYSTGTVVVPLISASLTRIIRVTTTNIPLFGVAIAAKLNIDLNGNGIATDSFDSRISTNGLYYASLSNTNGDIASLSGVINVGNSSIKGDVYLGPNAANTIQNGTVTGNVYNDFNADYPDVGLPVPVTSWIPLSALGVQTNIDGVSYSYYIGMSGDYSISAANGSIYVAAGARVRLYITGNFSPAYIRVAGSGSSAGSLRIYMGGASFTVSGQAIVDGGNAANLAYWGLPSNTSITMSGNASFVGTIYAPEADFKLGGGGSSIYDFVGSSITKTVTMNGHFSFHYDENLWRAGPARGYVATAWREL